ncbi:MAG: hypothetical protein AAGA05_04120 [Pseudomonadota bacterium]
MKLEELQALRDLTELAYQRDLAHLKPLLDREADLRRQLTRLDHQAQDARQNDAAMEVMRPMGADILWEKWLARTRRDLNTQLAALMAQKEHKMAGLRKSFGRSTVAADLCSSARQEARADNARRSYAAAMRQT